MRLRLTIAAAAFALATVLAVVIVSMRPAGPAFAGVPTNTPTPTSTRTPTPTPAPLVSNYTFTNTTGAPADALDIVAGTSLSFTVTSNAPGCDPPTLLPPETIGYQPYHAAPGTIYLAIKLYRVRWESTCVDDTESIGVQFSYRPDLISQLFFLGVSRTGMFFDSSIATNTPTLTPAPPTLTPAPPTFASVAIDCDPSTPGVQSSCSIPPGITSVTVDVVLQNTGPQFDLGAFGFTVNNPDTTRLSAITVPCDGGGRNCNPDFNNVGIPGLLWACAPPPPDPDSSPAAGDQSTIGCFGLNDTPTIGAAPLVLASVTYDLLPGSGPVSIPLTLRETSVYNESFGEKHSCRPMIDNESSHECFDATLTLLDGPTVTPTNTPPPTAISTTVPTITAATPVASQDLTPPAGSYFAVDCDLSAPGIQDACTYMTTDDRVDVGVVFRNGAPFGGPICCTEFRLRNSNATLLYPPAMPQPVPAINSNPDANEAVLGASIRCSPPAPSNDDGSGGPGVTVSRIGCSPGSFDGPAITPGSAALLATVHYDVPSNAQPGVANLTLHDTLLFINTTIDELGSCNPNIGMPTTCIPASITLIGPGPGVEKVPEGNANNTDLSIPAANLWICEVGPCAGPGEGALRVVEGASNVIEGLGAYEFTVEYDNFVIQSVNPCDLVFGPGGAGNSRGPVDELDASAINADCAPDPNSPTNGTCAMSLVLENMVHFGCASSGQAAGPTGDFDLASLLLIPHPDLNNDLFPGNNNGVLTVLKDNGCELVDTVGHPVTGSVNGGLTPYCRDLAVTVRILEGDLDLNCIVDLTDAQAIASRYGAFFGGLLYSKWYDLEPQFHDLDIDIKDVQKIFGRQDSTCQTPIPAQPPLGPPTAFQD